VIHAPQASCQQRAGRAGRVRPGHAFRLCTEEDYGALLPDASVPEMQRSELAGLLLQLKVGG
jgi:ATP-dependent RNA helicase DDX35